MAGALIEGLLKRGVPGEHLHVIDIHEPTRDRWQSRGLSVSAGPDDCLRIHRTWVLAVKPQQLAEVTSSLRPYLTPDTLVISIAAGIPLVTLADWLGSQVDPWPLVVRAMPNTPALVEKGITGLVAGEGIDSRHRNEVQNILSAVGEVVWVESDDMIDAITALSGSGPAYVFRFIEALIDGAKALGLDEIQAKQLALATVAGAAELALQSTDPVAVLRERVTSKGGTTQAALEVLEQQQFAASVVKAMQAAYKRAGELSEVYGRDRDL